MIYIHDIHSRESGFSTPINGRETFVQWSLIFDKCAIERATFGRGAITSRYTFALISRFILRNRYPLFHGIKVAAISLAATVDRVRIEPIVSRARILYGVLSHRLFAGE